MRIDLPDEESSFRSSLDRFEDGPHSSLSEIEGERYLVVHTVVPKDNAAARLGRLPQGQAGLPIVL
jgi:hypothetical protein